jgi:ABC-type lipopolysaccharide export system ATPase subunit
MNPKIRIIKLWDQLGFTCVSHQTSLYKKIYVKDNLIVHIEEKQSIQEEKEMIETKRDFEEEV